MSNIKVYEFCNCDLVVTNVSLEKTINWYSKEYQYVDKKYVEEVDEYDMSIQIEGEDGELKNISVHDYIADIKEKDMPMIIASSEY